ncbi:hypothetical protein [Malonomonas rubra]|uniref:hypothetical protein n=1 Tax=Malonomonas rubra TaxID=57040 RepID=UPI0026F02A11|nr:hypothetical protein [Malonomonas rubra]
MPEPDRALYAVAPVCRARIFQILFKKFKNPATQYGKFFGEGNAVFRKQPPSGIAQGSTVSRHWERIL